MQITGLSCYLFWLACVDDLCPSKALPDEVVGVTPLSLENRLTVARVLQAPSATRLSSTSDLIAPVNSGYPYDVSFRFP
jgi:hypothetical protein